MSRNIAEITRTLLMITVMVASALIPMAPAAEELRDSPAKMHAAISVGTSSISILEGGSDHYEISLDEAPDGVLV
ncbi:MAG: hypothetical protein QGG76_03280, partial [Candidatus Thalassarchaeaceae archaeon]|nr:hypothetical protein [Candidatus Thalassarchaeaceae archaeon]